MKRLFLIAFVCMYNNATIVGKNLSSIFIPKNQSSTSTTTSGWNSTPTTPTPSSDSTTTGTISSNTTSSADSTTNSDDTSATSSSSVVDTSSTDITQSTTTTTASSTTQTPTSTTQNIVIINNQKATTNVFGSQTNTLYLYLNNGTNSTLLTTIQPQSATVTTVDQTQTGDLFVTPTQLSSYPSFGATSTRLLQPLRTNGQSATSTSIFTVQADNSGTNYFLNTISTNNKTLVINNASSIDMLVRITTTVTTVDTMGNSSNQTAYIFYNVFAQTIAVIQTPDTLSTANYAHQDFTFVIRANPSNTQTQTLNATGKNSVTFAGSGSNVSSSQTVKASTQTAIYSIQEISNGFNQSLQVSLTSPTNF